MPSGVVASPPHASREASPNTAALRVPMLCIGLPGTGKTFELAVHAVAHTWRDMAKGLPPRRTLCLAAHNSALCALKAKMMKIAQTLDNSVAQQHLDEEEEDDERPVSQKRKNPPAAVRRVLITPSQQRDFLRPRFDTIHHSCRRWLIKFGYLIGLPHIGEVCSKQRAHQILDTLQSELTVDVFDEREEEVGLLNQQAVQDSTNGNSESEMTKATLRDTLSIVVPDDAFLRAAVRCAQKCRQLQMSADMLQHFFSQYKINNFLVTEALRERYSDAAIDEAGEMREYYDELLRHNRLLDLDDLIVYGLQLVQQHARHIIQEEKIGMIVLDDLHNTCFGQRQIVRALVGPNGTNGRLLVTCEDMRLSPSFDDADPSLMSVYRFSGASVHDSAHDLMQECLHYGQEYAQVTLTQNRRSTSIIQKVAYELLSHHVVNENFKGRQKAPLLCSFASIQDEAQFIDDEVDRIHVDDDCNRRELSSIAIVARCNEHIRFLVDELVDLGRPICVMGQENSDLSSDEAIDLLSFLGAAQNPALHHLVDRALVVFRRCANVPELTLIALPDVEVMHAYMADEDNFAAAIMLGAVGYFLDVLRHVKRQIVANREVVAILSDLVDQLQYKTRYLRAGPELHVNADDSDDQHARPIKYPGARWECVQALLRRASDFDDRYDSGHSGHRVDMFLRECHAYAPKQLAYYRSRPRATITLSTMHYALGTEYDVVFISSLEHGSLPNIHLRSIEELLEERKLLFLTILRARECLYLHYLDKRQANARAHNLDDDDDDPCSPNSPPSIQQQLRSMRQREPGGHSVFLNRIVPLLQRREA